MGRNTKRYFSRIKSTHLEEFESWLNDKSQKGWELKSISTFMGLVFHKSTHGARRYRIDVFSRKDSSAIDRISLYRDAGWEHVGSYDQIQIFRSPLEINLPEIHTDPKEFANNLESQRKRLITGCIGISACFLLLVGQQLISFLNSNCIYYFLNSTLTILLPFSFIAYLVVLFSQYKQVYRMTKKIKSMKEGYPFDHQVNISKQNTKSKIYVFIYIIFMLTFLIAAFHMNFFFSASEALPPIPKGALPVFSLSDIMNDQNLIDSELNSKDNGTWSDYLTSSGSILVPKQIELNETAGSPDGIIFLQSEYYQAVNPRVAKMFFPLFVDNKMHIPLKVSQYSEKQNSNGKLERLIVYNNKSLGEYYIFGMYRNEVYFLYIECNGFEGKIATQDEVIKKLEEWAQDK